MIKDDYEIQKIRDTAFCSGYNTAVSKYEKRNKELEKENAKLKNQLEMSNKVYNDNLDYSHHIEEQLTKAKEIILRLYNAGRDVLMCRVEEKAYDNLSNAINDKSIEKFLSEVEK